MVKFTYEQTRHLSEIGDGPLKLTVTGKDGKVLRPALKKWNPASKPTGCTTLSINGSQDHGVWRGLRKGRV